MSPPNPNPASRFCTPAVAFGGRWKLRESDEGGYRKVNLNLPPNYCWSIAVIYNVKLPWLIILVLFSYACSNTNNPSPSTNCNSSSNSLRPKRIGEWNFVWDGNCLRKIEKTKKAWNYWANGCLDVRYRINYGANEKISSIGLTHTIQRDAPDAPFKTDSKTIPFIYSLNNLIQIGDTPVTINTNSTGQVTDVILGQSHLYFDSLRNLISWDYKGIEFLAFYDSLEKSPFEGFPFELALYLFTHRPLSHECPYANFSSPFVPTLPNSIQIFLNMQFGPYCLKTWRSKDSTGWGLNQPRPFIIEGNILKSAPQPGSLMVNISENLKEVLDGSSVNTQYSFEIGF